MNIKLIVLVLAVGLAGCGVEDQYEPLVEWSGSITEQSDRFILRYDTEQFPESQMAKVEGWWVEIQTCAGVSLDISNRPLTIEYLPREEMPKGIDGRIWTTEGYSIVVDKDINPEYGDDSYYYYKGWVTRHELLHYLTVLVEGPSKADTEHTHIFWKQCFPNEF